MATAPPAINNLPIIRSKEVRYLGIHFHQNCSLQPEILFIRSQIATRRSLLYSLIPKNNQNDRVLIHAYKTIVRPIIDFRANILLTASNAQLLRITQAERKSLRRLVKEPTDFPSSEIYSRCQLTTLKDRLNILQTKFATNIIRRRQPAGLQLLASHHHHNANGFLLRKVPINKRAWPPAILLSLVSDDDINSFADEDVPEDNQPSYKENILRARSNFQRLPAILKTPHYIDDEEVENTQSENFDPP